VEGDRRVGRWGGAMQAGYKSRWTLHLPSGAPGYKMRTENDVDIKAIRWGFFVFFSFFLTNFPKIEELLEMI